MKNYYYLIWADALQRPKHHHPYDKDLKIKSFLLVTWFDAMYLGSIAGWLNFFNICNLFHYFNLTGNAKINAFLSYAILFFIPFLVINYFLIFWKNKYENIIKKYPLNLKSPSYSFRYCFSSLIFLVITLTAIEIIKNRLQLI